MIVQDLSSEGRKDPFFGFITGYKHEEDVTTYMESRYWIHGYKKGKLLIIDVDKLDFVDNPEDLGNVINTIDAEINGLF